jgi:putative endonuclease
MTKNKSTGTTGEEIAAQYLENKGYEIIARNWQYMHRELDIVAKKDNILVIVEVKTRAAHSIVTPLEAVTSRKQRLVISATSVFIEKHNINLEVRFDIISILYNHNNYQVEHIENAFYPKVK